MDLHHAIQSRHDGCSGAGELIEHVSRSCCALAPHTSSHVQESDASLVCNSYMPKITFLQEPLNTTLLEMHMMITQYEQDLVKVHPQ